MICSALSPMNIPLPLDISAGTSITIGNFDGVHLGHQALLALTRNRAEASGSLPIAITFEPHPLEVLTPHAPPRLTTTQSRLALLEASGMALVILIAFTTELAEMTPEIFVRRILLNNLRMRELFLGYDFTLGKGRAGTPEVLAEMGRRQGFAVERLDALSIDGDVVSSTRIRDLLRQGNVRKANALLGRLYSVRGEIIHGQNRGGRLLGFPTANLAPVTTMLPKPGVYATLATPSDGLGDGLSAANGSIGPNSYAAVTNIGHNPTFGPGSLTIETHLLDFDGDLYGKQLEVTFVERLRGEISFAAPEALATQIRKDTEQARRILAKSQLRVPLTA